MKMNNLVIRNYDLANFWEKILNKNLESGLYNYHYSTLSCLDFVDSGVMRMLQDNLEKDFDK